MFNLTTLPTFTLVLLVILSIVELSLKGVTLWKSGRSGHKAWFIALLVLNTAGILPLIYLLTHRKAD